MRRPFTRRLSMGLTAAATLVSVTACGSSGSPDTPSSGGITAVKVGVIPIVDVAPIYLGQKKGFFSEQGIKLTLTAAQGGAAIVPGVVEWPVRLRLQQHDLADGRPDQERAASRPWPTGSPPPARTAPTSAASRVKKGSPIKSAKDLEGKTVAVNTLKNIGDTTVRESVRKAGGDPSKVKFVEMPFDQMPAALAGGQMDAAWVVEPALATVKAPGRHRHRLALRRRVAGPHRGHVLHLGSSTRRRTPTW